MTLNLHWRCPRRICLERGAGPARNGWLHREPPKEGTAAACRGWAAREEPLKAVCCMLSILQPETVCLEGSSR